MTRLPINIAIIMEDIINIIVHTNDLDTDVEGVHCFINDNFVLIHWEDLKDLAKCPDINKQIRDDLSKLLKERGIA